MLPTPSTSHVSFATIYEPAEDSFLLLDTLSSSAESTWLKNRFPLTTTPTPLVAEIGTGSGVVIAFLAANAKAILGRDDAIFLGVDVNLDACAATRATVQIAVAEQQSGSVYLGSVQADLCTLILDGSTDILVFNPPYVPTDVLPSPLPLGLAGESQFEVESRLLALSYAGGAKGMETTDRLLNDLPRVLSKRGVAYVLLCAQNEPEEVKVRIEDEWEGVWHVETVGRSGKAAGWEKLEILRIWRDG